MKVEKGLLLLATVFTGFAGTLSAQSYYDDDIYYDASKAPKKVEKQVKAAPRQNTAAQQPRVYQTMPGADSYTVYTSNTRDVDEYNRRGSYVAQADSRAAADTAAAGDFRYTRRIEKFYNPEVVTGSGVRI